MNKNLKKQTISVSENGKRLDLFLSDQLNITRSQAQKMIKEGRVHINQKIVKKGGVIPEKDDIIDIVDIQEIQDIPDTQDIQNIQDSVEIIAETDDYLVINKPAGLLVHPTYAHEPVSIAAWVTQHHPESIGVGEYPHRPGIVHRLDKEASGVLVIAKNQKMFEWLKKQFQSRTVEKEYTVLVHGVVEKDHDMIDFAIDRGKEGRMVSRPRISVLNLKSVSKIQPGKEALTEFWVKDRFVNYTVLSVKIHTGRTHQIRVHFFAYNHPVVGDMIYVQKKRDRKKDIELGRLFLHARKLCFRELSGEQVCFEAHIPHELEIFLRTL